VAGGQSRDVQLSSPAAPDSADNAAVIAAAPCPTFLAGVCADDSLDAEVSLPLA